MTINGPGMTFRAWDHRMTSVGYDEILQDQGRKDNTFGIQMQDEIRLMRDDIRYTRDDIQDPG